MLLGQLFNLCLQIASDFLHRFHQRTNRKTGTTNTGDGLQLCTLTKHFLPQNAGETIRISNHPVCTRKCHAVLPDGEGTLPLTQLTSCRAGTTPGSRLPSCSLALVGLKVAML